MWIKKKKNVILIAWIVAISFIIYQLYFFVAITSANTRSHVIQVLDHSNVIEVVHLRSEDDKFINENGVIRGILLVNMPLYRPDAKKEFKCLKSGESIAFENVNDDYCDCEDGSDEPSTPACVNSTFYCDTQYKRKSVLFNSVPSSVVNDGVCDCCDGSDEWLHDPSKRLLTQGSLDMIRHLALKCPNICHLSLS